MTKISPRMDNHKLTCGLDPFLPTRPCGNDVRMLMFLRCAQWLIFNFWIHFGSQKKTYATVSRSKLMEYEWTAQCFISMYGYQGESFPLDRNVKAITFTVMTEWQLHFSVLEVLRQQNGIVQFLDFLMDTLKCPDVPRLKHSRSSPVFMVILNAQMDFHGIKFQETPNDIIITKNICILWMRLSKRYLEELRVFPKFAKMN